MTLLKAAINGGRTKYDHPATPVTPAEIAAAAVGAVAAGADVVHLHPRSAAGEQSITPETVSAALREVRAHDLRAPIGITTGLWCCADDADLRLALIREWHTLPDFASVAFSEHGAEDTAALLFARGISIESAVWSTDDIPALLGSRYLDANIRVLIEPMDDDPSRAVEHAREMAERLQRGGVGCPLLYHGEGKTVWPVLQAAAEDGHQIRIGIEDGTHLPDGSVASDNAALVKAARAAAARSA